MTNEELVRAALEKVGGKSNVLTATNWNSAPATIVPFS